MSYAVEMIQNQVYSVLIEDWEEEISGVFIAEGKQWVLLYDNQNDFLVEGFRFVNKDKIDEILREDNELLKEKIFSMKYPNLNFEISFDLDNSVSLFNTIKKLNVLLHFDTDDEEEIVVGKINEVLLRNFTLNSVTSNGEWGAPYTCDFADVSSVAIKNDYLNSLSLLL